MKISRRDTCDRFYLLQMFGIGVFIHKLHKSETKDVFHTHPWDGVSFILGSYNEQEIGQPIKRKSFFNFVKATTPHRIEVNDKPVWTLFIHGQKYNKWKVFDKSGKVLDTEPWTDTENLQRKSYVPA